MKKTFMYISAIMLFISCGSNTQTHSGKEDLTYGYSQKNPIKVGGVMSGPAAERKYLNSLTGPNGEQIWFYRESSCCSFTTKNSPFGSGALDIYSVSYEGKKDTVTLYLNMYDSGELKAPVGFKLK
jgi:hypothetical protein